MSMTENERKIFNLQDVVVALVSISEDVVSKEEFQRIDDKGAEIINCLSELKSYRAIGTIDEFKSLKEKSVAKKPRFYAHNYYCTECGNLVGNNEFEWQRFMYCDKCGQKLDWSE
jgi:predicted SprT family Zn-dependent metalloprotease